MCLKTHVCWIGIGIYKMCKSKQGIGLCLLWQPKIEKAKAIKSAHDKYIKNKYWLLIVRNSKRFFFLHSADHNQKDHFLYTKRHSAEVCKKRKLYNGLFVKELCCFDLKIYYPVFVSSITNFCTEFLAEKKSWFVVFLPNFVLFSVKLQCRM